MDQNTQRRRDWGNSRGGAHNTDPSPWWLSQLPRELRSSRGNSTFNCSVLEQHPWPQACSSSSSGTCNFLPPAGEARGNWTTPEVAEAPATPAYPLTSPNNGSACNPRISRCSGGVHHLVSLRATPAVPAALAVPRR